MANPALDLWKTEDVATKYARAERATRPYADIFVDKAKLADVSSDAKIFDLGSGTGAAIAAIYENVPQEKWGMLDVLGGDINDSMLEYLKKRGEKEGWTGLRTEKVDGTNIQLPDSSFTHIFANAIIFVLPPHTTKKCFDLLQPGGFLGFSTWATLNWWATLEKAVQRLPKPPLLPKFSEFQARIQQGRPWHEESYIREQLTEAGFTNVETIRENIKVDLGTPAQYTESITMPMFVVASWWEESERDQLRKDVLEEFRKVAAEEAGGDDASVYMIIEGIVGVGWKPT